ncbi:tyrosine-type recombinase/integrase [Saccharothrix hoggarensis]|uniref:Tyrosine-type recombinase/integrase n=1 Tax=Saccharothrix hoggarensis TaxID=913853 RepID=A0ABW3QCV1_9PSEU
MHALRATAADVKRWQLDMDAAEVPKSTRSHRLAVVGSLYAFWAEHGAVTVDPTRFDRRGLTLSSVGDTSRRIVLTATQADRLLSTAAAPRRGRSPLQRLRAVAIVALFTLGLRVGELTTLRREDLHTTRGRRALYVHGKGGKTRVVYLSDLAARALDDYLAERDRHDATATPARLGTVGARRSPLIVTRDGDPLNPRDVWALLRRLAAAAGPLLADLADRMHPHLLRHFYVTAAAEGGADMTDVQADVGHASVDTTNRVYNQAARHPDRSAVDIVEQALRQARATAGRPSADHAPAGHASHLARDSADATLLALRTGLVHRDPVELLHGLQQLDRALVDATMPSADVRTALELVDAALGSADSHDRVVALAIQVRQRLTGSPDT